MKLRKRDGQIEDFNIGKIQIAIEKAIHEMPNPKKITNKCKAELISNINSKIINLDHEFIDVETVQDIVEAEFTEKGLKALHDVYHGYRIDRTKARIEQTTLMKDIFKKFNAKAIENSNANMDEWSFSGRTEEGTAILQTQIALDYMLPKNISKGHRDGYIYLHDRRQIAVGMANCLMCDLGYLLKGYETRNGDAREAGSYGTACQLTAAIFQSCSISQYGGIASMHIDYDLAPYVKKSFIRHMRKAFKYIRDDNSANFDRINAGSDGISQKFIDTYGPIEIANEALKAKFPAQYKYAYDMLLEEVRQGSESLYHNLNMLESRSGEQLPFSSINFGRDTSPEGRLVTKSLLEASLSGVGKHHRTPIFPISIFCIKEGINKNPGDPNYDLKKLAIESTTKRIYPNYVNGDWSMAKEVPGDIDTYMATMGCRTLVGWDVNGFGSHRVGRGNINPTTIILPKIAIEYGICTGERETADFEGFYKKFYEILELAKESLVWRFEHCANQPLRAGKFLYKNKATRGVDDCTDGTVRNAIRHGSQAIGYIGLAEACCALFGKYHDQDEEVYDFALDLVKRINAFCSKATQETSLNFACYATPAENLCFTAMKQLRSEYGIIPGVTSRDYLTNSHHCPVFNQHTAIEKMEIEAPFHVLCTAGNIHYTELASDPSQNPDAVEKLIDMAMDMDIVYYAVNFPIDNCDDCGHSAIIDEDVCPECGSTNIMRLRRVTGYLTGSYMDNFNYGKIKEVKDRVTHTDLSR
jgi:ribonucleoside-triphosphate reductase